MITSLEIERLRGIRLGKLDDLTPVVVLVGPNGCGKSTVLDAFLIGADEGPAYGIARAVERRKTDIRAAPWLIWQVDRNHETKITAGRGKKQPYLRILEVKTPNTSKQVVYCTDVAGDGSRRKTEVWFDERNEPTDVDLVAPSQASPYVRLVETWRRATQTPLHQLYSQAAIAGRKAEAVAMVQAVVPELTGIEVLTDDDRPYLALSFANRAGPAALEGDGIHALIRICFELAAVGQGLVLMEEPEIHQHPGAIQQTMKAIAAAVDRGIQVVLSTHSLEVIDALLEHLRGDQRRLEKLALYRLNLTEGDLVTSRLSGPDVLESRDQIEADLR
jgi:energy-coupling factor transporter ATP-binding protein EcfA2